jgi:hypothetical protein
MWAGRACGSSSSMNETNPIWPFVFNKISRTEAKFDELLRYRLTSVLIN